MTARSPDGHWPATARTKSWGGPGTAYDATTVYLTQLSQSPTAVLGFLHQSQTMKLTMSWLAPRHLDVAYGPSDRSGDAVEITLQTVRFADVDITLHKLTATDRSRSSRRRALDSVKRQPEQSPVSHTSVGRVATALTAVYLLLAANGRSQVLNDSVRVTSGPIYHAADGSRSVLRPIGRAIDSVHTVRARVQNGYLSIIETLDDAAGCGAPHSVDHALQGDTVTVTTFDSLPQLCPAQYSPASYEVRIYGLRPGAYFVRYFTEGRGGRRSPPLLRRWVRIPG
jgi:hypothetical protein